VTLVGKYFFSPLVKIQGDSYGFYIAEPARFFFA
jgi:hypothetical protein